MPDFIFNRTIKKRRGVYSEFDIHAPWRQYTVDGRFYSEYYSLSTIKNIIVPNTTSAVKKSVRVCYSVLSEVTDLTDVATQTTSIKFIRDPIIEINDLGIISEGCIIKYSINDEEPNERFTITEKLNDIVISEKENVNNGNFTIDYDINLSDEQISLLEFNSTNNITIEISTEKGGLVTSKVVTFTKGNTKPKLNISSYNSTTAIFTTIDTDNNLSKIEWFIDDVLKETITTDLTAEKTINYKLTDNAIHTLKIVATDAENATVEKVLSISKEIMPLQSDATLQDISTKLVEIGEGFKNGKTSIINTLALKNIEASLNNTLVELSEKIKTSFDSSDASAQDLMNQLTQANNTISQLNSKYKYASGTIDVVKNSSLMANLYGESFGRQPGTWLKIDNLGFIPNIFVAECQYVTSNNYFFKHIVIATCNINWFWEKKDFSARIVFTKEKNSNQDFSGSGIIYSNNERDVYINNKGINVPASSPNVSSYLHSWHAIKFI
ncbi:hypothetical protein [Clostridioides difficile]|uniref:hypothetical protein n=2 Tax=Clostridioides difficile TaxID=1496 RepID=UPI000D68E498|nr:hypothetical protein [Clostridioides difficile]MDE3652392.1 hypothetical protein [Clostridioides difficile]HBE8953832.1 hypothetical protein [Clostridioides difficile]HBF7205499.1 hypothetical protein [Clostridioides difficile]HBF7378399.1 hypothetical protein [Clostridioides difficile]HBG5539835.1 hypothetical protein [Clostridioides difficile]